MINAEKILCDLIKLISKTSEISVPMGLQRDRATGSHGQTARYSTSKHVRAGLHNQGYQIESFKLRKQLTRGSKYTTSVLDIAMSNRPRCRGQILPTNAQPLTYVPGRGMAFHRGNVSS